MERERAEAVLAVTYYMSLAHVATVPLPLAQMSRLVVRVGGIFDANSRMRRWQEDSKV